MISRVGLIRAGGNALIMVISRALEGPGLAGNGLLIPPWRAWVTGFRTAGAAPHTVIECLLCLFKYAIHF